MANQHRAFFKAKARRQALKQGLKPTDTADQIRQKMLAVSAKADDTLHFDSIVESLLDEEATLETGHEGPRMRLIKRSNLDAFLWDQLESDYGYRSKKPTIPDFAITLFESCYRLSLNRTADLEPEALSFMKRWKDSRSHYNAFETLSERYVKPLAIEHNLHQRDVKDLTRIDLFKIIDKKIIVELVKQVRERTMTDTECQEYIWERRETHWYSDFKHIYQAIAFGSQFLASMRTINLSVESMDEGIQKYTETWHHIDKLYRKFIYHAQTSKQVTLLGLVLHRGCWRRIKGCRCLRSWRGEGCFWGEGV